MQKVIPITSFFVFLYLFSYSQTKVDNITIVRDSYGVPHIYAPTDAEVAYGLAWASAEDDFKSIQENLLAVRGLLGEVNGADGAILDFFAYAIKADEYVNSNYEKDLSPEFRKVAEGYTEGLNRYAVLHPEEVLHKDLFPITAQDLLESYVLNLTFLSGVHLDIIKIFNQNIARYELPRGSNGIALNSQKTADGNVYLAVNSHQPLEGPLAWYEAHVESEEGWQMIGANFAGGMTLFVGSTPNLGWTHTVNSPDLSDVYRLEMHPTEKLQYQFDGNWEMLTPRKFKAKVKLGPFKIPFRRKIYDSQYGLTFKNKDGYYSIRFPAGVTTLKSAEQWYRMNKATNFEEFRKALDVQGIASTNIIYADKEDNIFYIGNGNFPYRNPKYNWKKVLPGNTSETLWENKYYPVDSLPQLLNPTSGYVFNTNNMPFNATAPHENLDSNATNKTMGYQTVDNNRSLRFQELIAQYDKVNYDEFKKIKYDDAWKSPAYSFSMSNIEDLFKLDKTKYPHLAPMLNILNDWDRTTGIDSEGATIFVLCIRFLNERLDKEGRTKEINVLKEEELVTALEKAQKHLKKHFKTINVPLGDMQRHTRGEISLPVPGAPDVLAAMYAAPDKKGKFRAIAGESYIQLVQFTKDGIIIESVNTYGASAKEGSPHYTDQMELFVKRKTKKMTFDKDEIMKNAERIYHPK